MGLKLRDLSVVIYYLFAVFSISTFIIIMIISLLFYFYVITTTTTTTTTTLTCYLYTPTFISLVLLLVCFLPTFLRFFLFINKPQIFVY